MKHRFILTLYLLVWATAAAWSAPAPSKTTVSLELKQTPLHQALGVLFDQLGLQYAIDADVPDLPITLKVKEMPFDEALRAMLRLGSTTVFMQGAGVVHRDVTYKKEGDLYQIEPRRDSPMPEEVGGFGGGGFGGGGFGGGGLGGLPQQTTVQAEKIPLNYIRSSVAVSYLNQQPVQRIASIQPLPRDNALIVRGDPDAIQELKQLLQLADVPSRPLTLSAGIGGPGINGAPLAVRSTARALVGDDVTIDEQAVLGGQPAHLKVTLGTQLLGNGDLQIASNWDVSVPVAGGSRGPIRLVKRLSTTTLLHPGEQIAVAEVDLAGWGGKGVLRLWIRGQWGNAGR